MCGREGGTRWGVGERCQSKRSAKDSTAASLQFAARVWWVWTPTTLGKRSGGSGTTSGCGLGTAVGREDMHVKMVLL